MVVTVGMLGACSSEDERGDQVDEGIPGNGETTTLEEPETCGGIAGLPCPAGLVCVDDPRDDCDPRMGGADCSGICVDDPDSSTPPSGVTAGWSVCGKAICGRGTVCCNASCSLCLPPDMMCTQHVCEETAVMCGSSVCGRGEYCCNESCSICAPLDGACTQQVCDPE
ncbi:hypothetical protein [Chondromyces crocatus]|nr:hypothetical protein [Chondromyces crocatus]